MKGKVSLCDKREVEDTVLAYAGDYSMLDAIYGKRSQGEGQDGGSKPSLRVPLRGSGQGYQMLSVEVA